MKKYEIKYDTSVSEGLNEINTYLHNRIENIEKDFRMIENCEVELHSEKGHAKNCEVAVRLTVPRHKYFARDKEETFHKAAKVAFDELYEQLNGLKFG